MTFKPRLSSMIFQSKALLVYQQSSDENKQLLHNSKMDQESPSYESFRTLIEREEDECRGSESNDYVEYEFYEDDDLDLEVVGGTCYPDCCIIL